MSTPESTAAVGVEREQSKNIKALSGLWPFIIRYKWTLGAALFMLTFTALVSLILPVAVRQIIDGFGQNVQQLDRYFALAVIVAALMAVGSALRYTLVTRLGERVVSDIRRAVFDKMIAMSPAFFEKILTGEVLSRITTDTTLILSVIGSYLSFALRNAIIFVGGMIFMFITSPKLTGLVLLLVPVVLVPILLIGRRVRVLSKINQDKIAQSSAHASENMLAAQTVQAYTHEIISRAQFGGATEDAFAAARERINIRAIMTAIVIFMIFTGIVAVLWIGARDVRNGLMSAGELVQFVIYAVMVGVSVSAFAEFWGEISRAAGATERLVELLNAEDEVKDPATPKSLPKTIKGKVEFKNVTFRYPGRPKIKAIDGLSFTVQPGETVAVVGPSGAGKSTIFQLLMRFFDPNSGSILIDGVPIDQMLREEFRQHLALVPQEPVIFATTAFENVRFGRPDAPDDAVMAATHAAAAHEFLEALPEGYQSYVGERGVMLSGGQKQRLAIARAILRDAPILMLDEATSALDAQSERAVQDAVERLSQDRTTIVIAHRLATVKRADRILVMDQGRIIAQGTHQELVKQGGLYAKLAKLQFTDA